MPDIASIHHVSFTVTDLDRSVAWYKEVLGLAELMREDHPDRNGYAIVLGKPETALSASRLLEEHGFLVTAIRPPTVPPGTARLRLTFTAQHPEDEIERLAHIIRTQILARSEERAISAQ